MPKALVADSDLCTGCEICSNICAFKKFKSFNPRRARVAVIRDEPSLHDAPVFCIQCGLCINACPTGAISWKDDIVVVDEEKCNGDGRCAVVCPYGAIHVDPVTNVAIKCDTCMGKPACVQWCPQGVLSFVDVKDGAFYKHRNTERLMSRHGGDLWWGKYKLWMRPWYKR